MAMARVLLSTLLGERRWNQTKLANVSGVRPNTINLLYHELADSVKLDHLDQICKALNCKLDDLVRLDDDVKIPGNPYSPEFKKLK
jgi:putative transcriptional regulator